MTKLVLDNLDETIVEELKRRADQHGWSAEDEARHILASAVGEALPVLDQGRRERGQAFLARADAIRERYGSRVTSDTVALLREDRDR